ncbi:MAG: cytochrome c [Gammaproteobacteria bacterium]|jgi:mono/diheme cytochrome c family protein
MSFLFVRKVVTNITFAITALMLPALVQAWPWSQDMMNQPSIKPQEGVMYPFPKRSIPVQGVPTKVANREEAKELQNPIPVTEESLKKGRTLFRIICSACHGLTGKADSPVSAKIGAIDLTDDYVQNTLTEGWIWGTITFGSFIMPPYGVPDPEKGGSNDLSVEERWHVVNYVKHGLANESKAMTASKNQ